MAKQHRHPSRRLRYVIKHIKLSATLRELASQCASDLTDGAISQYTKSALYLCRLVVRAYKEDRRLLPPLGVRLPRGVLEAPGTSILLDIPNTLARDILSVANEMTHGTIRRPSQAIRYLLGVAIASWMLDGGKPDLSSLGDAATKKQK